MPETRRPTDLEWAEIQRRRPGTRVSPPCVGKYPDAGDAALFVQIDGERLNADQPVARTKQVWREKCRQGALGQSISLLS